MFCDSCLFAVYAFAPRVLDALHVKGEWAAYGSVHYHTALVGCVVATRLINTMGRRKMVIQSFFVVWFGITWIRRFFLKVHSF